MISCLMCLPVADPDPPNPVKTSPKNMAAMPHRKFGESSAPLGQISGSATVCHFAKLKSRILYDQRLARLVAQP